MLVTREEVKVYTPEEGNAIKLTKDGKVVTYMVGAYYELPQYNYTVTEVPIEEAERYFDRANSKLRRAIRFFK